MFLRLLKQDLRATARVMIVLYAVVLVLSGATRVTTSFMDQNVGGLLVVVFARLLVILFAVAVAACVVMTFVLMIIRFYKNFLTDEGYLMFTLPVTKGQLIRSPVLVMSSSPGPVMVPPKPITHPTVLFSPTMAERVSVQMPFCMETTRESSFR